MNRIKKYCPLLNNWEFYLKSFRKKWFCNEINDIYKGIHEMIYFLSNTIYFFSLKFDVLNIFTSKKKRKFR